MSQTFYRTPYFRFGVIALIFVIGLFSLIYRLGLTHFITYLIAINITSFLFYGYDKLIAGTSRLRVPEAMLHTLAIMGGSPAGLLAQKAFKHKTIKRSFQTLYWLIVILQISFIVYWYIFR